MGIMSKLSRGKKGENKVRKALEELPGYHHVLNDITFIDAKNEMSHQIDHILIHPNGIFVIETKTYFGDMEVTENGAWVKTVRHDSTRIHNPLHQNKSHAKVTRKVLGSDFDVIPVVVFANNNAPYVPDDNVINLKDLPLFIDSYPYVGKLGKELMDVAKARIEAASVKLSKDEHLENIGYLKEYRKAKQQEITIALEQGICPWCGKKVEHQGFHYYCISCKFDFTL
jgi:hypothetical protein